MCTFPIAAIVTVPSSYIDLDRAHSSYLVLISLAALALAAGVLFRFGLFGGLFYVVTLVLGVSIRRGFLLWERLFSWASWPRFLAIVLAVLVAGWLLGGLLPAALVFCGLATLFMGTTACLAYMFIDLERYEVERGHKAIHNPLKGQQLAVHVAQYGQQVQVPLLLISALAMVGGFSLLNQGLFDTIGKDWFRVARGQGDPIYVDFLAYTLINLLGVVDVLDLARTQHLMQSHVRPSGAVARLPAAGRVQDVLHVCVAAPILCLASPGETAGGDNHGLLEPARAHLRARRNALPQYGSLAIEPLLTSLRFVPSLTREQRDQLPLILATIGPSTIPALIRHLHDAQAHVRAVAVAALGCLHARETTPLLAALVQDADEVVRQSVVEALGALGGPETQLVRTQPAVRSPRVAEAWDRVVARVEDGCRANAALQPDCPGRGDVTVRPDRRVVGRANSRCSGAGSHRARRRSGGAGADRLAEGCGRNGALPGGGGPGPGERGARGGCRSGRAAARRQRPGQGIRGPGAGGDEKGVRRCGARTRPALAGPGGGGAHGGGRGCRSDRRAERLDDRPPDRCPLQSGHHCPRADGCGPGDHRRGGCGGRSRSGGGDERRQ